MYFVNCVVLYGIVLYCIINCIVNCIVNVLCKLYFSNISRSRYIRKFALNYYQYINCFFPDYYRVSVVSLVSLEEVLQKASRVLLVKLAWQSQARLVQKATREIQVVQDLLVTRVFVVPKVFLELDQMEVVS